jgi:hypothetical protein
MWECYTGKKWVPPDWATGLTDSIADSITGIGYGFAGMVRPAHRRRLWDTAYRLGPLGQAERAGPGWYYAELGILGLTGLASISALGCMAIGFDPWIGTGGIHPAGAHHGMGKHFELILRVGQKTFKLIIPGLKKLIYMQFK